MNELRTGMTTGTCAAAAAKAAAMILRGDKAPECVSINLPYGEEINVPIESACLKDVGAEAVVVKDAGDDPDVTDGSRVVVYLEPCNEEGIKFIAGDGVGTVTRAGLQVKPGEAAINPVPRMMIENAVREISSHAFRITVSIPGGKELAEKTFNPRLGIAGGLSILGTSGRVRPYSHQALRDALICGLDVAIAGGKCCPVFTPGNIGTEAATALLSCSGDGIIEVSNEWGFMLEQAVVKGIEEAMLLGHPGKLAKLSMGYWDTHSSRSPVALDYVRNAARDVTSTDFADCTTVEGIFDLLSEAERRELGDLLAGNIRRAVEDKFYLRVAVVLVDMKKNMLGYAGEIGKWKN